MCALLLGAGCTVGSLGEPEPGDPGPGETGDPDPGSEDPGDPDPGTDDPDPTPDYSLSLTPPQQTLTLGTATELVVSLGSSHFEGPVSLTATGAPASWNVSFSPSDTVQLAADGTAEVTVIVEAPTSAEATTADLSIEASADPGPRQAQASVTLDNLFIVPIESGTGGAAHAFPELAELRLGAAVRFVNYDSTLHRIHAGDGEAGFPHQDGPGLAPSETEGMPGGFYEVEIAETGTYEYYCHEHDQDAGVGALQIVQP